MQDGARAGGTSSPFTIASIRKAMQYATSMVVEGSSSAMNSARRLVTLDIYRMYVALFAQSRYE